ncbi:Gfo/Idh/MocA family oxidoreductase [Halalkalibacter alkalisediminis]|uniref:Gfo/Idh/MocA family oxidoreductase n=1 Tax=Halalkalibacter alkalisediminis TaxID=935616 RepID=A0ABV6NME0_9BACI|nr:Gfo/Idh/MocA family oxidoreductase [Halalkalibacter alkalisediminis]
MGNIKLGMIGISEGNGHPYSWSAIFNGYNRSLIKECPFPSIPNYLSKQKFPKDAIKEGQVTHLWTQDKKISQNIAQTTYIENIVENYVDMIGKVDAILLARDDFKLHYKICKPFIEAGLPIYIDKPLANNIKEAKKIFALEQYEGQIFTCSALHYAKEFSISQAELEKIGPLQYVDACVMNSWGKYAVHIIEPVVKMIGSQGQQIEVTKSTAGQKNIVTVCWESGLQTTFTSLGNIDCPIKIRLFGEEGCKELVFKDTYYAFKKALQTFVDIIQKKEKPLNKHFVLKIIEIIEKGI